jgi:hypothetical protein
MLGEMLNAVVIFGGLTIIGLSTYMIISYIRNRRLEKYYKENPDKNPLGSEFD